MSPCRHKTLKIWESTVNVNIVSIGISEDAALALLTALALMAVVTAENLKKNTPNEN